MTLLAPDPKTQRAAEQAPGQLNITSKPISSLLLALLLIAPIGLLAATPMVEIEIRDHLFNPAQITIPASTKVKLMVINQDPTPEEFESYELNREKVIAGNSRAVIFVGPLPPGSYPFFGEFYPKTAQGVLIVE